MTEEMWKEVVFSIVAGLSVLEGEDLRKLMERGDFELLPLPPEGNLATDFVDKT